MKLFEELSDDNFLLYAAKHYYKPNVIDASEFYEDLNRFRYLKRLINRYEENGVLSDRLMMNHIIIIFNVFGIKPALRMLEYKVDKKHWNVVKPFLIYLKYIKNDEYTDISMDKVVVEKLRKI